MNKVPSFKLYGADDSDFDNRIQPKLPLRSWDSLSRAEKQIALLKLRNEGFFSDDPDNSDDPEKVMEVIIQLNNRYLRLLPGKNMHYLSQGKSELQAGIEDFENIFMNEPSGDLVLCMLSIFVKESYNRLDVCMMHRKCRRAKKERIWSIGRFDEIRQVG